MRTVRRLFVVPFAPTLLAVAMLAAPAAAQADLERWGSGDAQLHPYLGSITDDPGPFNTIDWTTRVMGQIYVPPAEEESSVEGVPPAVQFNPVSGYPIAVWSAAKVSDEDLGGALPSGVDARGYDVLFSHFTVGGWTGPTKLAEAGADPSLAIDPSDGTVHLLYWTPRDGGSVWHRQAPADLTSWTDPIRVSDAREAAARPTARFHGNTLTIVYESHVTGLGSTPREIVLAQRQLPGEPEFSRTVLATTPYAGRNWVHLDSDGRRLLVRWVNADNQAGWILQDEGGGWGPVGMAPLAPIALRETEAAPQAARGRGTSPAPRKR